MDRAFEYMVDSETSEDTKYITLTDDATTELAEMIPDNFLDVLVEIEEILKKAVDGTLAPAI
jgi:hypothetical protein